jgi:hypothetical protein
LDLEREAFVSLCGEPKTQERIGHMLKNRGTLKKMKSLQNYHFKMVIFDSNENLGVAFIADDTGLNLPSINGVLNSSTKKGFHNLAIDKYSTIIDN